MELSAHELTRTVLCPVVGCPNEEPCSVHGERRRAAVARRRTCEEVPGCTRPTISDRGRYARVCEEHKDLVTARYSTNGSAGVPVAPKPGPEISDEELDLMMAETPTLTELAQELDAVREHMTKLESELAEERSHEKALARRLIDAIGIPPLELEGVS
jgi:hypothetical protein